MARIARVVAAGVPHHITQRGNRRQKTFFTDADYQAYLELMADWCGRVGVQIWCYCLMPNHVHLIAVPERESGLRKAIGEAHRRYTRRVNFRKRWRGHLWQGRFASFAMDDAYLWSAARYVLLNPVRAGLVRRPEQYRWSSAAAHLANRDDALVRTATLAKRIPDWRTFWSAGLADSEVEIIRRHERTGRPLGSAKFVKSLEQRLFRKLQPKKPGPKPKCSGGSDRPG